jgi:hypothetical protein
MVKQDTFRASEAAARYFDLGVSVYCGIRSPRDECSITAASRRARVSDFLAEVT